MSAAPLRVMIVDDEAPARSRMRDLLADCADTLAVTVVGEAATGKAALEMLQDAPVDVVLLDIRMPGMDGIELARHLRRLARPPAIVFTTAYDEYAVRAFDVHAVDYLLKPIRRARLAEALARAQGAVAIPEAALDAARGRARAFLSSQERGRIVLVPIEAIVYFRAEDKYVAAHTAAGEHLLEESLARLEQEYAERFVRVHRNCLVARQAIRGFERGPEDGADARWSVLLKDSGVRIPVSRRPQHVIREVGREGP
jgi:two-component system response regulator AlgR